MSLEVRYFVIASSVEPFRLRISGDFSWRLRIPGDLSFRFLVSLGDLSIPAEFSGEFLSNNFALMSKLTLDLSLDLLDLDACEL